ncbi:SpoIIE family protein phosphatase [Streptomyces sp. NPDC047999]|uniref:SpoIIE family protein phosphatase n=1 Tax=Streptomyces sp. NPDC047999 TaxID=3365497 RepID=UPI003711F1D2
MKRSGPAPADPRPAAGVRTARAAPPGAEPRDPVAPPAAAALVLDARGSVIGWSPAAEDLLGHTAAEAVGRPVSAFVDPPGGEPATGQGRTARAAHHRDGRTVRVAATEFPLSGPGPASRVLLLEEYRQRRLSQARLALLDALATQSPLGLAVYDRGLRLAWANAAHDREVGRPLADYRGMHAEDLYPDGAFLGSRGPRTLTEAMRRVIDDGEVFVDLHFRSRLPSDPDTHRVWSCSYYRLQDAEGRVLGVCEDAFDITPRYEAQNRLALLAEAGRRIGTSLDVTSTARAVADVAVPGFASTVTVDLDAAVLAGGVPAPGAGGTWVRVAARSGAPPAASPADAGSPRRVSYPEGSPQRRSLASGGHVLAEDTLVVPLRSGGTLLGLVTFLRSGSLRFFDTDAVGLADELVSRAALGIDNARRFTGERAAALALQRQLLPQRLPDQSAVDVAGRYLPADDVAGVGGDWFDVIPLSGARVGLVVGDVVGHGLPAAATMGRLRTAVEALATLDLAPDEVLTRLDDLLGRGTGVGADAAADVPYPDVTTGATCLYAVYDPVSRRCTMARAGHLPPVVVHRDGSYRFPDLPAGPPLGLGGLPFEAASFELPAGSLLALFTDGLVEVRDRDIEQGLRTLGRVLGDPSADLDELCDRALDELRPGGRTADDTALLLVRTRELDAGRVAVWDLPAEPASAGRARSLVTARLDRWGLGELAPASALVVSELVTNAVRHAEGPLQLRLIRDRALLCEVADTTHTSPHLRHSSAEDEGGRGLLIVARLVERWGTRYTPSGKTIWTEQPLPGPPSAR